MKITNSMMKTTTTIQTIKGMITTSMREKAIMINKLINKSQEHFWKKTSKAKGRRKKSLI